MMEKLLIEKLSKTISKKLPGENAHIEMLPLGRGTLNTYSEKISSARKSAVAVLLYHSNNTYKSLLIKRSSYNGNHSGEISFPGGKFDKKDKNLESTAIRECHEEIGLPPIYLQKIGKLTDVYIPVSNFLIEPFLFIVNSPEKITLKPDEREVSEIIEVDIHEILDPSNMHKTTLKLKNNQVLNDVPCFKVKNNIIVWGATALILNEFKLILKEVLV